MPPHAAVMRPAALYPPQPPMVTLTVGPGNVQRAIRHLRDGDHGLAFGQPHPARGDGPAVCGRKVEARDRRRRIAVGEQDAPRFT